MSELGDVLELLHGAARRVTTLTATLLDWHDEERALRAVEAAQHHGAAIGVLQHKGEPPRQSEQRTLVHYRQPRRYRLHRQANAYVHRPHDVLQVCDGEREWTYVAAERQAYVQAPSQHELFRLLDPSWLPATCTLSVAGHSAHEGRQAVELHGRSRPDLLDRHLHHLGFGAGQADELHAFRFTPPRGVRVDDLSAHEHRRPPIIRGPLGFRLRLLRRRLGHRIRSRRGRQGTA